MNLRDISIIVTTYNEENNLDRCLRRLDGFGEIVLVDSFSSDGTVDIGRRYAATIYVRPYRSAAKQKNWALEQVRNDWVLVLDADEEFTDELREELAHLDGAAASGYWIRRDSEYLGRRIRHCGWQRDKVLRFFRRDKGRYDEREVHEEVTLDGPESVLRGRLRHYPYAEVTQHLEKINEYSTRGSRDYVDRGGRMAVLNMLLHPPFRFVRMYLLQGGLLDGRQGFILCLLSSYSVFLKYAKAWEYRRQRTRERAR